jgi:dihydroorotase
MRYERELVIPSPIDLHTHLREPGGEASETIESGTRAAARGGYQAVVDMPNNPGGNETWTAERVDEKAAIARSSAWTDIGFYGGVNFGDPDFDEIPRLMPKVMGTKFYMGFTTNNTAERTLDDVRPYADQWIRQARELGLWSPILLHARDGAGAETARYIAQQNHPVHWCHIASITEIRHVAKLRNDFPGLFTSEVTMHHLTMTAQDADMKYGWNGGRMQPPLGNAADAEELLHAYNSGIIQILATDHAPHPRGNKLSAELKNPQGINDDELGTCYGVSGIEFVLPVMMSLVARGKTTLERVVDSLHTEPLRMLRIPHSAVARSVETTVQFSPYIIAESDIAGHSANTPYINWTAWGKVLSIRRDEQEAPSIYEPQIRKDQ